MRKPKKCHHGEKMNCLHCGQSLPDRRKKKVKPHKNAICEICNKECDTSIDGHANLYCGSCFAKEMIASDCASSTKPLVSTSVDSVKGAPEKVNACGGRELKTSGIYPKRREESCLEETKKHGLCKHGNVCREDLDCHLILKENVENYNKKNHIKAEDNKPCEHDWDFCAHSDDVNATSAAR